MASHGKAYVDRSKALPAEGSSFYDQAMLSTSAALAAKFGAALEASGLTQTGVALACGVSKQAVQGWKKTGRIDKQHLPKIAEITGYPLDWWLDNSATELPSMWQRQTEAGQAQGMAPLVQRYQRVSEKMLEPEGRWPFTEITPARYDDLSPKQKAAVEGFILGMLAVTSGR